MTIIRKMCTRLFGGKKKEEEVEEETTTTYGNFEICQLLCFRLWRIELNIKISNF